MSTTNEQEFQDALAEYLDDETNDKPDAIEGVRRIETFKEGGVMTMNAGLVLHLRDGSEFQVTIVKSR